MSKPTVSRALSDSPLVNAKTREHVLAVAREHGYAVNRNAQKLRHKLTNTIGVSIDFHSHRRNHITDPFMFDLLAGVSEALGDRNQDLLLTAPNHNDLEAFRHILLSRGVDGFIFLGRGVQGTERVLWDPHRQPPSALGSATRRATRWLSRCPSVLGHRPAKRPWHQVPAGGATETATSSQAFPARNA